MPKLRLGTRGSELALWQARHVAALLAEHAGVESELVIIKTQGDREGEMPAPQASWSTGAFVAAIEQALAGGEVDLAIHSFKDLATRSLPGLAVVATPPRAAVHDVLAASSERVAAVLRAALAGNGDAAGLRVGTSSPRRVTQLRRELGCATEPIRGNVPTRLAIATRADLDAVCLAAAGVERLGLPVAHAVALPIDRFPTAPAQGAVAVQAREGTEAADLAAKINHGPTSRCAAAERAFLGRLNAGCQVPVAANATLDAGGVIRLHVQLFNDRGGLFEERADGTDPRAVGEAVGERALAWYRA
ncbi:MAG: hydroxymethylbilane synthase [Phycisphaerales bacterium]|nr:hydroxymethylbilane synthase [Phycisphaerales bacterium]